MKIISGITFSLLLLLCTAIGYGFGVFSTSFDTNLCYSTVIGQISDAVRAAEESQNEDALDDLSRKLDKLPLHGYESNCEEVKLKVKELGL